MNKCTPIHDFMTPDRLICILHHYETACETDIHAHEFLEIQCVMSGNGRHIVAGREYEVEAGDIYFIDFKTEHVFISNIDEPPIETITILFMPEFLDGVPAPMGITKELMYDRLFCRSTSFGTFVKVSEKDFSVRGLALKMLEEYSLERTGFDNVLRGYLTALLALMERRYEEQYTKGSEAYDKRRSIEAAMHFINEHFKDRLSLASIAKEAFLTPNYFCARFKDVTGITVTDYIKRKKIMEACELLVKTDKTVENIALEIGYTNLAYFRKAFKAETGMMPAEYRKS